MSTFFLTSIFRRKLYTNSDLSMIRNGKQLQGQKRPKAAKKLRGTVGEQLV